MNYTKKYQRMQDKNKQEYVVGQLHIAKYQNNVQK